MLGNCVANDFGAEVRVTGEGELVETVLGPLVGACVESRGDEDKITRLGDNVGNAVGVTVEGWIVGNDERRNEGIDEGTVVGMSVGVLVIGESVVGWIDRVSVGELVEGMGVEGGTVIGLVVVGSKVNGALDEGLTVVGFRVVGNRVDGAIVGARVGEVVVCGVTFCSVAVVHGFAVGNVHNNSSSWR
jgi:hypothetical protein